MLLVTGVYSQTSLKASAYAFHSKLIVCASISSIPLIINNKWFFLMFIFWNFCYFQCRAVESVIYNSLVYDTLKKIENTSSRLEYLSLYSRLTKPSAPIRMNFGDNFFKSTHRRFRNFQG